MSSWNSWFAGRNAGFLQTLALIAVSSYLGFTAVRGVIYVWSVFLKKMMAT